MAIEIERKFLLKPFNIENYLKEHKFEYKSINILQFYLFKSQEFIRVRKYGKKYFLTIKRGEGIVREEYEKEISENDFNKILSQSKDICSLSKKRFVVKVKNYKYEIDRFENELKGLFFLEIEFKSKKEAKNLNIDKRFKNLILVEVTENKNFSNYYLAKAKSISSLRECKDILNIEEIDPLCSTKEAALVILHSLFRRALFYKDRILNQDKDIENLHQLRVSLRKMIVFLKEFKDFFEDDWYKKSFNQIKEIIAFTNKKRDIDVLILNFDKYLLSLPPSMKKPLFEFRNELKNIAKKEEERVLEFLKNKKIQIKEILENIVFTKRADFLIITTSYAIIKKQEKKIFKLANKIDKSSSATKYHKLRIEFKKLRYLLEFFSSFYQKDKIKIFIENVKKIQDILGMHQDLYVQREHIKEYLKLTNPSLDLALSIGKLLGDMEYSEIEARKIFRKKYKKLSKMLKSSTIF